MFYRPIHSLDSPQLFQLSALNGKVNILQPYKKLYIPQNKDVNNMTLRYIY